LSSRAERGIWVRAGTGESQALRAETQIPRFARDDKPKRGDKPKRNDQPKRDDNKKRDDNEKWEFSHRAESNLSSGRHEVLKAWIAAILWLIVIAIESTPWLSSHNTSRILYPLLHFLFGLNRLSFEHWHFYIRKSGHFVGYAILSFLLFRAWRVTLPVLANVKWAVRWASLAVLGTALVASLDEWHQTFIPSRTGRWQDVVLDTCGGLAAQILVFLWLKLS
jgi:VanZ family protein